MLILQPSTFRLCFILCMPCGTNPWNKLYTELALVVCSTTKENNQSGSGHCTSCSEWPRPGCLSWLATQLGLHSSGVPSHSTVPQVIGTKHRWCICVALLLLFMPATNTHTHTERMMSEVIRVWVTYQFLLPRLWCDAHQRLWCDSF